MSLGSQIRRYREAAGLTLEQLAELTDVDVGTISALENRGSERSKYAATIARRGFGLSLEQLLDEQRQTQLPLGEPAAPENVTRLDAREPDSEWPRAKAAWPFAQVSPEEFGQLSAVQRAQIEGFVLGLVASGKQPHRRRG